MGNHSLSKRAEAIRLEARIRTYRRDPVAFLTECWHIRVPGVGKTSFAGMYDAQRQAIHAWQRNRWSLTLKARQIGWTTAVAGYAAWLALFHDEQDILFVSRGEREAMDILRKVKYGLRWLPADVASRLPTTTVNIQTKVEFSNDSLIESLPSKSDPARGRSASLIVVDEWAFLENAEEAWASIQPVADVGGRVIGLSTANGQGNFFHRLWLDANLGLSPFEPMFFPWSANPNRDQAWYEAQRQLMLDWQLAQEFPSTPEEAFIKSGNPVFSTEALERCRRETLVTPRRFRCGRLSSSGGLSMVPIGEQEDEAL